MLMLLFGVFLFFILCIIAGRVAGIGSDSREQKLINDEIINAKAKFGRLQRQTPNSNDAQLSEAEFVQKHLKIWRKKRIKIRLETFAFGVLVLFVWFFADSSDKDRAPENDKINQATLTDSQTTRTKISDTGNEYPDQVPDIMHNRSHTTTNSSSSTTAESLALHKQLKSSKDNDGGISADAQSKSIIRKLQTRLKELGFDPGPPDGLMGKNTRRAIFDYQRQYGLRETGKPSKKLLTHLGVFLRSNSENSSGIISSTRRNKLTEEDRKHGLNVIELTKLKFEWDLDQIINRRNLSRTEADDIRRCMYAYFADLRRILETEGLAELQEYVEQNKFNNSVLRKLPKCRNVL